MLQYVVVLGSLIQLIGCFSYIKGIVKGTTKPNRVTWLLWSIAPIIASLAALSKGVTIAVLPTFVAGFGPLLVFLASFITPNSYWKLGKNDYICGIFSVLALILWIVTSEANIAIIFAILSDFTAALPTFIKAWREPQSVSIAPFTTGLISTASTFFALAMWNFSELAFPIYLLIINTLLILTIKRTSIFKVSKRNL